MRFGQSLTLTTKTDSALARSHADTPLADPPIRFSPGGDVTSEDDTGSPSSDGASPYQDDTFLTVSPPRFGGSFP
jgi:hypothetical protein